MPIKEKIYKFLKAGEKYLQTDIIYLAKGGGWYLCGKLGVAFISFFSLYVLGKYLPKKTFGVYQYILSVMAILTIFSLPQINTTLIPAIAQKKDRTFILAFKTKLKWATLSIISTLFVSGWYFLHHNKILGISFLLASFLFPFTEIFNIFIPFWQGKKRFDLQSKYILGVNILEAISFLPVVIFTQNLIFVISAYLISRVFFKAIFFLFTLKHLENKEISKKAISLGKHLTLMEIFQSFIGRLDTILIWQILGPIGVSSYFFAKEIFEKLNQLIPLGALALPKISEKKDNQEIKKSFLKKLPLLILFYETIILIFFWCSPLIYNFFFPKYKISIPYFQILLLAFLFTPFSLTGISFLAKMRKNELYILNLTSSFFHFVLILTLIPSFKIWGAIFAFLGRYAVLGMVSFYLFKKLR